MKLEVTPMKLEVTPMKLEVTERGMHDQKGEPIEVGTILTVTGDAIPASMINKVRQLGGTGQMPVLNVTLGYAVVDKGRGWFVIEKDGEPVTKSMREDDVSGFDDFTEEEKAAFVADNGADD